MRKKDMTLIEAVKRIDIDYYRHKKAGPAAVKRLYLVAEDIGEDMPINKLDEVVIDKAIDTWRNRGNKDATINRKLSLLSKTLRMASSRWRVNGIPMLKRMPSFIKLEEPEVRIHLLSAEEEEFMLFFYSKHYPEFVDIISFLLDTGCRLSEMNRVQGRDIDWINNVINIYDGKAKGKHRAIPMTKRVQAILRRLTVDEGLAVPWSAYNKDRCRYLWDRCRHALDKEGDAAFHLHCLRHTCATRLLKAGVSVPVVSRWLGHSTLDMTMRYLRLVPSDLQDACKLMEDM